MSSSRRVAIVGCGGMAHHHAQDYVLMPETDLVAVCDIDAERAASFAKEFEIEAVYTDVGEMIDSSNPEIVAVATRPIDHAKPTIEALKRGVHVLCEKSLAPTLVECDSMIKAAEDNRVILAVNTQRRTEPYHRHAKMLLEHGLVGDIRAIHGYSKSYPAAYNLQNIGSHLFDSMRLLMGDVEWVHAHLTHNKEEIAPKHVERDILGTGVGAGTDIQMSMWFSSGADGTAEMYDGFGAFGWEVVGLKGSLALRGTQTELMYCADPGWYTGNGDEGAWESLPVPCGTREKEALARRRYPVELMMLDVLDAIDTGRPPASSGEHGRAAVEIIAAAYQSQLTSARMTLPMTERHHPLDKWLPAE